MSGRINTERLTRKGAAILKRTGLTLGRERLTFFSLSRTFEKRQVRPWFKIHSSAPPSFADVVTFSNCSTLSRGRVIAVSPSRCSCAHSTWCSSWQGGDRRHFSLESQTGQAARRWVLLSSFYFVARVPTVGPIISNSRTITWIRNCHQRFHWQNCEQQMSWIYVLLFFWEQWGDMGDSRRKIATLHDTIAASNTFQKAPPATLDIAGGCVTNQWEESARSWGITYALEPEAKKKKAMCLSLTSQGPVSQHGGGVVCVVCVCACVRALNSSLQASMARMFACMYKKRNLR